jgi:hypothetical protein
MKEIVARHSGELKSGLHRSIIYPAASLIFRAGTFVFSPFVPHRGYTSRPRRVSPSLSFRAESSREGLPLVGVARIQELF